MIFPALPESELKNEDSYLKNKSQTQGHLQPANCDLCNFLRVHFSHLDCTLEIPVPLPRLRPFISRFSDRIIVYISNNNLSRVM